MDPQRPGDPEANDILYIQIKDHSQWDISLFDAQRRLLRRQAVSGSQTIGLKEFHACLYMLRAISREQVLRGKSSGRNRKPVLRLRTS